MNKLRIGIGQLNSRDDISKNFNAIETQIEEMASLGAQIVVFPEYSTYLSQRGSKEVAETMDGDIVKKFKALAMAYQVYLHNGSFLEKDIETGKCFNTSLFISPEGEILAKYRKIHLFDVEIDENNAFKESDTFEPGNEVVTVNTPFGTLGFAICYDIRFPDLFRALSDSGAEIIFLPAAFTLFTGKDHWEPLIRARAIENQVYMVAAGQFGERPVKKMSFGNSMVVDPWGTVIAKAADRPCTLVADIDLDYLKHVRKTLPSLKNKVDISSLTRVNNK